MDQGRELSGTIHIVDDNDVYLEVIGEILRSGGFRDIRSHKNPVAAFGEVDGGPCDLLILDMHMPELSGLEFLSKLKVSRLERDPFPVLILTGDDNPETRESALALGTMDYLIKPFRRSELLLRVRNLMHMRLLHTQVQNYAQELEERVINRTRELNQAHLDTVYRLARTAEFRDDATGRHIYRVAGYSRAIATDLGMEQDDLTRLYHAAQLHDIGKVAIPDRLILKAERLTSDEFEIMKMHTSIGAQILHGSPSKLLQMASVIALTHHERWNGSGYPSGLAGEDIPLVGRIVAVADVYDALTHERPYKHAWTQEEAINEFNSQRGVLYDPVVVDAFLATIHTHVI